MKSSIHNRMLVALALTCIIPTLRAQIVADGATNTLSNVSTNFTGDVTIGTNGSFTLLILSDNALLTNSANGVIGLNLNAKSNEVQLLSPTARWRMGGSLFVGSNGAMSRLVVSNGAFVDNNNGALGNRVDSSHNFALVTGAGSLWSNRLDLRVGTGGRSNQLIVSHGGWVASQSGFVGNNAGANYNFALVSGSGSVWSNALNLTVGFNGVGNRLVIEAGGLAHCDLGKVGDFGSATDNEALVTGTGSRWNVQTDLTIGRLLGGNRLIVSNGAAVKSGTGVVGGSSAVSNQVVVTGAGSEWRNQNDLTVGNFGPGNQLVVTNGGTVSASNLFIGFTSFSTNNSVTVDGGTLRVTNAAGTSLLDLRRGTVMLNAGLIDVDQLVWTNSQGLLDFNGGTLITRGGLIRDTQSEIVVGGSDTNPAVWDLRAGVSNVVVVANAGFSIGKSSSFNQLLITNGGRLVASVLGPTVGSAANSRSNSLVVSGAGSRMDAQGGFSVGGNGAFNSLVISNGGWVTHNQNGYIGNNGSNNVGTVTGEGSLLFNTNAGWGLFVGVEGDGNRLVISNGGGVVSASGYIGYNPCQNNEALVTGNGSYWSNRSTFGVGSHGGNSRLLVTDGATVTSSDLFLGIFSDSTNNRVVVDGGTLFVTNAAGNGTLDVRRGTNQLDAGLIAVDRLLVTNAAGVFEFNSGTLRPASTTIANGRVFTVGNGLSLATLQLFGGTHSFANSLVVPNNATLSGDGTVVGTMAVSSGGTLSPGDVIGTLVFSSTPSLNGAMIMEVFKLGATQFKDQIQVAGLLVYSGSLTVTNIGTNALVAGDNFKLFDGSAYVGSFAPLTLPPLTTGLGWMNKLLVDGSIEVESLAPAVTTMPASALGPTNATLNGLADPNGTSTSAWFEFGVTTNYGNLTPPQSLGSGTSDTNFSATLTGLLPGVSYHFRAVASNSFGVAFGTNQSFKTLGPEVQTLPASAIGSGTAKLNGVANPDGLSTTAWFEWGPTTNYGNLTPPKALGGGTGNTNFSEVLTCLAAGVTHHFRAVASNSLGVAFGADRSFTTHQLPLGLVAYLKASDTEALVGGVVDGLGFAVAVSGDTVVVGSPGEGSNATGVNGNQTNNSADASGAAYVFVRNGNCWTQQAYLKASSTGELDQFGGAVAISGGTIVVTARFEDSNATGINGDGSDNTGTNSGAAYVFVRNGTNWTQQAYLKPSNTGVNDNFGNSVAVSGDIVVVGSPFEDSSATGVNGDQSNNSATDSGAAYVFARNGTNWTQQAYLKPNDTTTGDVFGGGVTVSDDTVVVGSRFEDSIATNSGAAYVFVRNGTNWTQQAQLKAGNAGADDEFGRRVALSGETVVAGAALEDSNAIGANGDGSDNSAPDSGAAYVFVRTGTNWTQQAYLKPSNTEAGDNFGLGTVAVSGGTVVVGAQFEDSNATGINGNHTNNSATDSGAAYVFVRSGTNWTQQAYLKASNTEAGDQFGFWVTVSGDTVVVGSPAEGSNATGVNGDGNNNNSSGSGAAYVFDVSPLTAPVLTITGSSPGQVTLAWIPPTPGFVLQESLSLSPVGWSNSPSGETNPITIPATEQTKFFRLFKP